MVGLLKHTGVDGKQLNWDLQVNASVVSVELLWIKTEKSIATIGQATSRPPKRNTSLLPTGNDTLNASTSGRRKGMKPLVALKLTLKQTENSNNQIDEATQTDQQHSQDQALHKPLILAIVMQRRERSTREYN